MIARPLGFLLLIAILVSPASLTGADEPAAKEKGAKGKAKALARELNPFDRPEGSIVDQTARYYVWYDTKGWHLRTTAKGTRTFHGTIKVEGGRIKSCVSVGLDDGKQKGTPDAWKVNKDRNELRFQFKTSTRSDGFDLAVEGVGQIEFDLGIDMQKNAKAIFVGRELGHPDKDPFRLPVTPEKK